MSDEKKYKINEIFYSLQGEGIRAGTAYIFVRFSNCNMKCAEEAGPKSPGGFDCDTEFESGRMLTLEEIENDILDLLEEYDDDGELAAARKCTELVPEAKISVKDKWMILTGGEPGLQATPEFCIYFRSRGWKLAIETNGSLLVAHTAGAYRHEHSLKQLQIISRAMEDMKHLNSSTLIGLLCHRRLQNMRSDNRLHMKLSMYEAMVKHYQRQSWMRNID